VGVTAKGAYELRPSPFGAVFYGVEMQATAIANLLDGQSLEVSDLPIDLVITIGFGLIIGLGLPLWRPALGSVLSLALFLGYNLICAHLFNRAGYVMPMAAPNVALVGCVLAILAYRLSTEERRRSRVTRMFGLFVPPEVVEHLTAEDSQVTRLQADRREITVLFADVRDFTHYSERSQAEDVVALLSRFFSLMHEIVWRHGGTLDKYMGDGLMAFFGAPTYQEDHPERAVLAAVEMRRQIGLHRAEWAAYGFGDLRVGIGLHTGEALVGYAGSKGRMQYTCLGNTVNLASRLEGLNREFNTDILISDALYERVKGVVDAKPIGGTHIRGLSSEVLVYAVLGAKTAGEVPQETGDDTEHATGAAARGDSN
jgi:adenylate cyclase